MKIYKLDEVSFSSIIFDIKKLIKLMRNAEHYETIAFSYKLEKLIDDINEYIKDNNGGKL